MNTCNVAHWSRPCSVCSSVPCCVWQRLKWLYNKIIKQHSFHWNQVRKHTWLTQIPHLLVSLLLQTPLPSGSTAAHSIGLLHPTVRTTQDALLRWNALVDRSGFGFLSVQILMTLLLRCEAMKWPSRGNEMSARWHNTALACVKRKAGRLPQKRKKERINPGCIEHQSSSARPAQWDIPSQWTIGHFTGLLRYWTDLHNIISRPFDLVRLFPLI